MSDEYSAAEATAKKMGEEYGRNAAEWAIEPDRMSREQMLAVLRGIEDGDPAILNQFKEPDLSGEITGNQTVSGLTDALGIDPEDDSQPDVALICEAWEEGAHDAFWSKIQETLLYHTKED